MWKAFTFPSVQIVLCVLVYLLVGYQFGAFGFLFGAPGLAAAIARPVINLIANLSHRTQEHIWMPVHGEYYLYKDVRVNVLEDEDHCRWVKVADVRKVVGTTANDRTLAKVYTHGWQTWGKPPEGYLRDDALFAHLTKENRPASLKMAVWVQRNILMPAQKVRAQYGIRIDPLLPQWPDTAPQALTPIAVAGQASDKEAAAAFIHAGPTANSARAPVSVPANR